MIDVEKWLTDDMGFTPDEAKAMMPGFQSRADKLEKGFLRLTDYSRNMNDLKKLQESVTANNEKLTADMAEWAEMTAAEKRNNGDLLEKIEKAQTRAYALEQRLIRVATEQGVDPKTLIGDAEPAKEPAKKEPAVVDLDPIRSQIGGVANYMLDLQADLPYIAEEHRRLTGQPFDSRAFVAGIKADIAENKKGAILDPVKRWEAANDIPAKREAKRNEEIDARISTARAEERTLVLSEQALPTGSMRPGEHAPVFRTTNVAGGSKLQRPQPSQRGGVAAATAAFASGKYRTKVA